MTKTKQTYRPNWHIKENASGIVNAVVDADGDCIAIAASDVSDRSQVEANARLIAAAPELLEMLQWHLSNLNANHVPDKATEIMELEELIAKAEGKQ